MKKIKTILLSLLIILSSLGQVSLVKADTPSTSDLVNQALTQKTFYHYNVAYNAVVNLPDGAEKDSLLGKLGSISGAVWSEDIKNINKALNELVNTASGKVYDDIQATISKSSIAPVDKDYLLGEVTSWGKKLVWTADYSQAMNALFDAWTKKDSTSVDNASALINQIKNQYSRDYLLGELSTLKATISGKPAAPAGVSAKAASDNEIYIQWDQVSGADYYYVYYSNSLNGNYLYFSNSDGSKRKVAWSQKSYSASLVNIGSNKTVFFKITAVKGGVESDFSTIVSATTLAAQTKFPLLSTVPSIPNVNYTSYDLSEDQKIVHYYYTPDSLPANIMDTYRPMLESNGWIFDEKANELDGYVYYFYKGEELLGVGFFGNTVAVYGTIH